MRTHIKAPFLRRRHFLNCIRVLKRQGAETPSLIPYSLNSSWRLGVLAFQPLSLLPLTRRRGKSTSVFIATASLIVGLTLYSTGAQAVIVYDPTNNAELVTQFNQMVKQYQQQLQQLNQAVQQTGALTGTRTMGSIANGPAEAALRQFLPSTWANTMKMGSATGLNSTGAQSQSLYNSYYTTNAPVTGAAAMTRDPTGPISQSIDRKTQTTYASMAASEESYNSVAPRTATYETLLQQVNTTTDLKSSVDLQSRIAAENGLTMNEMLRTQNIQIQQKAAEDNQQLTAFSQSSNVNRYDATQARSAYQP